MDSLWVIDSAADMLCMATALWATLCVSVLYVDRAARAHVDAPVVPLDRETVATAEERLAA